MRIVIADDEAPARALLRRLLGEIPGARVVAECVDGRDAVEAIRALAPDVVLLDVQMREMGGFGVIDAIGAERMPPVIFVTAHDEQASRAFDVQAVDFVVKPPRADRLALALSRAMARRRSADVHVAGDLRALVHSLRDLVGEMRSGARVDPTSSAPAPASAAPPSTRDRVTFGDVTVDLVAHTVTRAGVPVTLSPRAYALLAALVSRPGEVLSRARLLRDLWGYSSDVMSRTIDMHVVELRRKLEPDPNSPRYILTIRKSGYRFDA